MLYSENHKKRRLALSAAGVIALAPAALAIVTADRDEPAAPPAECRVIDSGSLTQLKPLLDRPDQPVGAAFSEAMTTIAAARRLCDNGDTKAALALYRRAEQSLTRFQSGAQREE